MSSGTDSKPGKGANLPTRMIHLDAGQRRDEAANCRTMIVPLDAWEGPAVSYEAVSYEAVPYEALFVAHYRAIREVGRSAATPGVAVVAVHVPSCRLAGRAWLSARAGAPRTAVIGRHSEADLMLDDPGLSLRHLLVVVPPPTRWDPSALGYEVLDLRTSHGFRDERGRRLEGLATEGPAFVSCGPYALFFLQTGDPTDWPQLATDAWAMLPSRVHVQERGAEPDRWRRGGYGRALRRAEGPDASRTSVVTMVPSLLSAGEPLLEEGEEPLGLLRVESEQGEREVPVGRSGARRGVLLGRYARCDASDLLSDEQISRAHLLVQRVGEDVVAIDTASTHGTCREGDHRRQRVVALGDGEVAILAEGRARVAWTWAG